MNHAPHHVDVVVALDLMEACVRSFPRDHEIRHRRSPAMVELALAQVGADLDDLRASPIVSERGGHARTQAAERPAARTFTIGAVIALRSAYREELQGSTWERALVVARRDVIRLLDVVPQTVFDAASAARSAVRCPTDDMGRRSRERREARTTDAP